MIELDFHYHIYNLYLPPELFHKASYRPISQNKTYTESQHHIPDLLWKRGSQYNQNTYAILEKFYSI